MKTLWGYLAGQRHTALLWLLTVGIFWWVGLLYALPGEALGYASVLSAAAGLLVTAAGFPGWRARRAAVAAVRHCPEESHPVLPDPPAGAQSIEGQYRAAVAALADRMDRQRAEARRARDALQEDFALWAHQIKTPLAALHLLVQSAPGEEAAAAETELFRTERYVDMALNCLRLSDGSADLVVCPTALDPVIRRVVRRFARMFILHHLSLRYDGTAARALTDARWLGFVLEQLLSNAVKYTPDGGTVTITADAAALCVADTGIGIPPEDLPRVFEKGYTGRNGRDADSHATGLGLYLSARAAARIGASLQAGAAPGGGTAVTLHFPRQDLLCE
ncbi:MAG: sensor histidine kinase [Gemmiger sp.]|uniref:sensor histidine kinase n=1 Tax=Gemmiger sp. TaxID=2049027 RepID=UPI002E7799AB|nr:sensor histidine kinase [Gemmiger sp.]MEE0801230.1 sensor histidine kinase [Gemmiger sp.]